MSTVPTYAIKSVLFVPGSRPERFAKALASGAEKIIVDFEDAVEEHSKEKARENLGSFLEANPDVSVLVRINAHGHPQHLADIDFCSAFKGVSAVVLPKAESAEQIRIVSHSRKPLWPLIESARGLQALPEIAQCEAVERLTFGGLDLGLDLGMRSSSIGAARVMDQVRYQILVHSVINRLAKPLDTVFPNIEDSAGLATVSAIARDMGFGGVLCIHPKQVEIANRVFAPDQEEMLWAKRVLAAAKNEAGAFSFEGRMIDAPVLSEALLLLQGFNE